VPSDGRVGWRTIAWFLVGVAGLAMSITLLWLGMRSVMDVGGACADGGPYVSAQSCPDGAPLATVGGMFGLFLFGGLITWKGSSIGGGWGSIALLGWPALFLSLGWNFFEYGFNPPAPPGQSPGWEWGWIVCGVVFGLMGGIPLLLGLAIADADFRTHRRGDRGTGSASRLAATAAPNVIMSRRPPAPGPARPAARSAAAARPISILDATTPSIPASAAAPEPSQDARAVAVPEFAAGRDAGEDIVSRLERLAVLHSRGELTDDEFEHAKEAVLVASVGASAGASEAPS
jgi:hypothetical protein